MQFLLDYGLFLAKAITVVISFIVVIGFIIASKTKTESDKGHIEITDLNELLEQRVYPLREELLNKKSLKEFKNEKKKQTKESDKKEQTEKDESGKIFVLTFNGDVKASDVDKLREEISAILQVAKPNDEVVLKLESGGGMVHSYGLASSQLDRIKRKGMSLTICVDKIAASGGYMMACVGDKILSAPFAIVGSIGVVAQMPNFHKILQKNDIDYELHTAGEFKRTLTMFGENTDKAREKFQQDIQEIHDLFKNYVSDHRPNLEIATVANGDVWLGTKAKEQGLVDEVMTSDEYIIEKISTTKVYEIKFKGHQTFMQKIGMAVSLTFEMTLEKIINLGRFPMK